MDKTEAQIKQELTRGLARRAELQEALASTETQISTARAMLRAISLCRDEAATVTQSQE